MSESALTLDVFNQPMKVLEMFNRLDVSEIEKLKNDPYHSTIEHKRDDGVSVRRSFRDEEGTIWEELTRDDSNFMYISLYNGDGVLLSRSAGFYDTRIASTHYKPSGKLVDLEDRRKPFKFKLDDLRKLLLEKYKIDILKKKAIPGLEMELRGEPPKPYYFVWLWQPGEDIFDIWLVDGNTGEFLHKKEQPYRMCGFPPPLPKDSMDVYEHYQMHLKKENGAVKK